MKQIYIYISVFFIDPTNDDSLLIHTKTDGGSKEIDVNDETVIAEFLFEESKAKTIATG